MIDKNAYRLACDIYSSEKSKDKKKILQDEKWKSVLSIKEIDGLNEAFNKFRFVETMVILESSNKSYSRENLWEQFLMLEDEAASADQDSGKKPGFLGKAWEKVKKGAKSALKSVAGKRATTQFGSKGAEQRKEFEKLSSSAAASIIDAMNAAVGDFAKYPNMDSNAEFQKMTNDALKAADELVAEYEYPEVKALMYDAVKKWVSYVLDQKLGDYYKHFEESASTLGMMINEAENEKEEEKPSALGTKSGESRTIKGLKSNIAPAVLGAVGAAGALAAGILKAHPDLLGQDTIQVVTQGSPEQATEIISQKLGPLKITDWTARGSTDQVYQHLFGSKPTSSEDYVKLFKALDPSGSNDASAGAKNLFDMVGIKQGNKVLNSDYVLNRLSSMSPDKAFDMPGVGPMERWGGRAGIPKMVIGLVSRQLRSKAVTGAVKTVLAKAGISTAGAAAMGVAGTLAAGGILSAIAIKLLRNKSLKNSRAQFLDSLIDNIGKVQDAEENKEASDSTTVPADVPSASGETSSSETSLGVLSGREMPSGNQGEEPSQSPGTSPSITGGEEKKESGVATSAKLSGSDMRNIIDNVMKDQAEYESKSKSKDSEGKFSYRSVSRDIVTDLVKYLNGKGKLQYIEGDYNDNDEVINKDITAMSSDEDFLRRIPPEYRGIITTWNQSQPAVSNDISRLVGDNKLPLYMLANRRALVETLRLIRKYSSNLLNEKKNNSMHPLNERWQRLAGIMK